MLQTTSHNKQMSTGTVLTFSLHWWSAKSLTSIHMTAVCVHWDYVIGQNGYEFKYCHTFTVTTRVWAVIKKVEIEHKINSQTNHKCTWRLALKSIL